MRTRTLCWICLIGIHSTLAYANDPPTWVLLPEAEAGFAASGCTPDTRNISVDRQWAIARARADLARNLAVAVKNLDSVYAKTSRENGKTVSEDVFESSSEQVTEQSLAGSRAVKVEYLEFNGQRQLCALVQLGREESSELFRGLVSAAEVTLDPAGEDALYREFVGLP
ncbi:MAG: hypothetical protein ACSHXK_06730 [Oceanococcus sp.]